MTKKSRLLPLDQLVGPVLTGYRIEKWFELGFSSNTGEYIVGGYFSNKDIASASDLARDWYSGNCSVREVYVLTVDGVAGYLLTQKRVEMNDEATLEARAKAEALSLLNTHQIKLLGLDSEADRVKKIVGPTEDPKDAPNCVDCGTLMVNHGKGHNCVSCGSSLGQY